jgi:hypothetical protein
MTVAVQGPASAGTWPAQVTPVEAKAGTVTTKGNLSTGKTISLAFASKSSNACWPATENVNFSGNHVFYATQIPAYSEMKITVIPDDRKTDLSVYAYMQGTTDTRHVPPNVPSAVTCEAGYDAKKDSNSGASESVKLNATNHPYNVVIGVAGAKGVTTGSYTLKIELTTRAAAVVSANVVPIAIASKAGVVETTGKLETGGVFDLAFAANSSNACWPATENVNFNGNHVLYRTTIPPQSEMTVTAVPSDSKTDVSVYAMMIGATDTTHYPPNMPSSVTCEAGYDYKKDSNPGVADSAKIQATTHSYNVIIGVAGANGAKAGAYTLKVDVHPR